ARRGRAPPREAEGEGVGTPGNLGRLAHGPPPPLRPQAALDHRVRLPDAPARPHLRRGLENPSKVPRPGVRDRAEEPAHPDDDLVPREGRVAAGRLAVGLLHYPRPAQAVLLRLQGAEALNDGPARAPAPR